MKLCYGYYYWVSNYPMPLMFEGEREYDVKYGIFRFPDKGVVRIDVNFYSSCVREYNP